MTFAVGQRVRTTVDAPAAKGFTYSAPAGTLGTVMHLREKCDGYGALLDGDPSGLDAYYDGHELESADV